MPSTAFLLPRAAALLLLLAPLGPATAQAPSWLPSAKPAAPLGAPSAAPTYKPIKWDVLMAPDWDQYKGVKPAELQALTDNDPRATELLKQLRSYWDNAPVNLAMVGQPVRIAGYVVPLEQGPEGLKEFLLVPTYGACIHTPPPPSSQIIHVVPRSPAKSVRTMDTVWINGTLKFARNNDSGLGWSSWRMEAVAVEPYGDGTKATPLQ